MNLRFGVIIALILGTAMTRLAMSGIPNISPVTALALFSGVYLADRKWFMLVPLVAMLLGDGVLGIHNMMPFTYSAFILISMIGMLISNRACGHVLIAASLVSSMLFFLLTNFGVWIMGGFYPMTWDGLLMCYIAAIPFFQMTLIGDLFFVGIFFCLFMTLEYFQPGIRRPVNRNIP